MAKLTREQFQVLRIKSEEALRSQKKQVLICAGTGCIAGGSLQIYDYIKAECERRGLDVYVGLQEEGQKEDVREPKGDGLYLKRSGCHGFCEMGPLLHIEPQGIMYIHVKPEDCDEIIEQTIIGGQVIPRLLYELDGKTYAQHSEIPFYKKQR